MRKKGGESLTEFINSKESKEYFKPECARSMKNIELNCISTSCQHLIFKYNFDTGTVAAQILNEINKNITRTLKDKDVNLTN